MIVRRDAMGFGALLCAVVAGCSSGSASNETGTSPDGAAPGSDGGVHQGDDSVGGDDSGVASSDSGAAGDAPAVGATGDGGSSGAQPEDVPMMHKHINRDGLFVDAALTKAALMGHTLKLDPTFAAASGVVDGHVYASPLYVANGAGGKGTFYVVTENDNVYAIDETTGTKVWTKSAGIPAGSSGAGCGNIGPLGITGTPAIDLATRLLVFDASTATSAGGSVATHTIHAWSIDDGHEAWSLDVSTLTDPTAGKFMPKLENERSAVLIVGGIAYVTYGGHYGDCGAYRGWIVGVPLTGGPSKVKSYVVGAIEAGMWAAGGPSSDGTSVYAATGNGDNGAGWKGAFSVLRFGAGPVFAGGTTNYFHAVSDVGDEDLGGSAPLVIDAPSVTPSQLLVQLGKDHNAYVINRANLGGEASPVSMHAVMNDEISNVPAWATTANATYVAMVSNNGGGGAGCVKGSGNLAVMAIGANAAITVPWCADNKGGGSPSITSSDGTHDALVWTVGTEGHGVTASSQLHAWDLETGAAVVTGSDTLAGTRHFSTPIFVHGRVIVAGDDALYALKP